MRQALSSEGRGGARTPPSIGVGDGKNDEPSWRDGKFGRRQSASRSPVITIHSPQPRAPRVRSKTGGVKNTIVIPNDRTSNPDDRKEVIASVPLPQAATTPVLSGRQQMEEVLVCARSELFLSIDDQSNKDVIAPFNPSSNRRESAVSGTSESRNAAIVNPTINSPLVRSRRKFSSQALSAAGGGASEANGQPHYHILVVDDSPISRKMLRRTLEAAGHTCEEAEDGLIAVNKVKENGLTAYDVILMDFVMVIQSTSSFALPPLHSPLTLCSPFPLPSLLSL